MSTPNITKTIYDNADLNRDHRTPLHPRKEAGALLDGGLMEPIHEKVPKPIVWGAIGLTAAFGAFGGGRALAQRVENVFSSHSVTKHQVVDNARDSRSGYNQVTTTTSHTDQAPGSR